MVSSNLAHSGINWIHKFSICMSIVHYCNVQKIKGIKTANNSEHTVSLKGKDIIQMGL